MIQSTIGVDFASKTINYKESTMKLQIWDSAGQERYKALIPSYVRGASIVFIVYDVSDKDTFKNIEMWINFIKQVNTDNSVLVLCGNKIDLKRQVSKKQGENLAKKEGLLYFETSAKTGENVNRMLYTCIVELPFFQQFENLDKNKAIEDLMLIYNKINTSVLNVPNQNKDDKVNNDREMNVNKDQLQVRGMSKFERRQMMEQRAFENKKCC